MPNVDDNTNTTSIVCHSALKPPPVIPEDTIAKRSRSIDKIVTIFVAKFPPEKEFPTTCIAKGEIKDLAKANDFIIAVQGFAMKCN